jgi:hypothetical protein
MPERALGAIKYALGSRLSVNHRLLMKDEDAAAFVDGAGGGVDNEVTRPNSS